MTDGGSKDGYSPCGVGALQAGVFWLLEEKILHKGRSGVNRGDRKIFGGKRRMSPDRFCLIRAIASYGWSSFVAFVERHEGRVPLLYIARLAKIWGYADTKVVLFSNTTSYEIIFFCKGISQRDGD